MEIIAGATLTILPAHRNPEHWTRKVLASRSGRSTGTPFDGISLGFEETPHVNGSPPPNVSVSVKKSHFTQIHCPMLVASPGDTRGH